MGQSSSRSSSDPPLRARDSRSPQNRALSPSAGDDEASHSQRPHQRRRGNEVLPDARLQDAARSGAYLARPARRSRLSRARASFTNTIPHFLARPMSSAATQRSNATLLPPPIYSPAGLSRSSSRSDLVLPQLDLPQLELDFDSSVANALTPRTPSVRERSRSTTSLSERISSLRPDLGLRNMTASLRRRRAAFPRPEDQAAMLSRLLSVAAAATAASLMGGNPRTAFTDTRNSDAAAVGEDGTFDSFLQSLQNGQLATALRQSTSSENSGGDADAGSIPPLNFFRMFRFGSQANHGRERNEDTRPSSSDSRQSVEHDQAGGSSNHESNNRMVPVLIVGIRSMGHETGSNQAMDNPFLDALSNFQPPATPGENDSTTNAILDGFSRPPRSPSRFGYRRRSSMSGFNLFSGRDEGLRRRRGPELTRTRSEALPIIGTDSPPGPRPPPSTPADAARSALSSGTTTPSRRASVSSTSRFATSSFGGDSPTLRSTPHPLEATEEEPINGSRSSRQNRSNDDALRFGSGNPRRNGMVEPDVASGEGSRSWIIYVLGGTYPENHPILTTPSLFTDSPTYEDMLLLSSLLGPAKPPVATAEEVASAPGLFKIETFDDGLVAVSADGEQRISIAAGERCLICLTAYEPNENVRQLVKCNHVYHQECIDEWLTTGRNSCPLCRGQGVDESGRNGTTVSEEESARAESSVA